MFAKSKKGLVLLLSNPLLLVKRIFSELRAVFWTPHHPIQKKIGDVFFEFDFTFDPSIRLMYENIYEVDILNAMKRYLLPGDVFVDAGANIGYLSAVGLNLVGREGQVHAFEPVPQYFHKLQQLVTLNPSHRITVNHLALGETDSTAKINITNLPNIGWNTLVPGLMSGETVRQSIEVTVKRLDVYLHERGLNKIAMIKIDTEGYEFPVLKGLSEYLKDSNNRPVLMVEIAPSAYPLLGVTLGQFREFMQSFRYRAFHIHHRSREVDITLLAETTNVLFIAPQ